MRKAEGRSCSPQPRRSGERHSREEWERRREESPRDREPLGPRRAVPPRSGRPKSSSREKAYTDSQRDVNEGTINVLRSMHAKLMTLQGQTGKNSGYPYFDGTLKEYPKFRRRWHTFQDLYHKATPLEGAGEPLQGELPREEGGGQAALRGNHGRMLEGVGPLLQQANAVCAGSDV